MNYTNPRLRDMPNVLLLDFDQRPNMIKNHLYINALHGISKVRLEPIRYQTGADSQLPRDTHQAELKSTQPQS